MTGVYAIRHIASGRVYVGSSLDVYGRWASHTKALIKGRHHSIHLQRAWTKYGSDAFEFVVLEWCDAEERVAREQCYIDLHRASDKAYGFNISPRADSPSSSPEVAARISASLTGRSLSVAHLAALRAGSAKRPPREPHSPETRVKLSDAAKRRASPSAETRAKMSAAAKKRMPSFQGKTHSSETRARLSAATRKQFESPEARAAAAERQRGKKMTAETRVNMVVAQQRRRSLEKECARSIESVAESERVH